MGSTKEIQTRMKSIQDTMKITNAMYMISSSKMQKAKRILSDTEPYYYNMQAAISRILRHMPDTEHPFFSIRHKIAEEDRKIGCIVVTGDKGMAGAYNHNIQKMTEQFMAEHEHCKLYVLGMVGRQYFTKKHMDIAENFPYTVQKPTMHRARLISEEITRAFLDGELDEVRIFYTEMQSAVAMEPVNMQLLPLKKAEFLPNQAMLADMPQEEIVLSPSADVLLNTMIPNYLTGLIYGCLVEAYASENNARMMAMQSSTDSAKKMLRELSIEYNRARQAAITQEITEIVSGAKAQKRK